MIANIVACYYLLLGHTQIAAFRLTPWSIMIRPPAGASPAVKKWAGYVRGPRLQRRRAETPTASRLRVENGEVFSPPQPTMGVWRSAMSFPAVSGAEPWRWVFIVDWRRVRRLIEKKTITSRTQGRGEAPFWILPGWVPTPAPRAQHGQVGLRIAGGILCR